jgi:hypothetical protein
MRAEGTFIHHPLLLPMSPVQASRGACRALTYGQMLPTASAGGGQLCDRLRSIAQVCTRAVS